MPKDSPQPPSINAEANPPARRETERLLDQMDRMFRGEAWHGPSLLPLLAPVSAPVAALRPLPGRHTIWELTLHLTAWIEIARERLAGARVEPTPEQDWPPVPSGAESPSSREQSWRETIVRLERAWEALESSVRTLDDNRLGRRVPGCPYTAYTLVHGVIQHLAYHGGQIALLSLDA